MDEDQFQTIRQVRVDSLTLGEIVAGKYRVESVLGTGGMGVVYRVTNIFFEKEFALKLLDQRCTPNAVLVKRFQNEAKAAFSLNHPNLVKVHDFGILDTGEPYLVMDLVSGETLADLIKRQTVIPYEQYLPILEQICAALSYAHSNSVIHRDVKPANIMISDTPNLSVKILDFGIAKIVNEEIGQLQELTRTGEIVGSPFYMSPEQCSGGTIDHRTDIYSLGCVTYEALTGAPPHVGVNALRTMMLHQTTDVVPMGEASLGLKFPPLVEQVVARMLAKEPSERYSEARAITEELNPNEHTKYLSEPRRPLSKPPSPKAFAINLNAGQLAGLIVLVMIGSAAATYFAVRTFLPSAFGEKSIAVTTDNKDVTESKAQSSKPAEDLQNLDKVHKIDFTTRINNGRSEKVINFPPFPIGQICIVDKNFDRGANNLMLAQGVVVVPNNVPLRLIVNESMNETTLLHPNLFKLIDPTLFSDLCISSNEQASTMQTVFESTRALGTFDAAKHSPAPNPNEPELEARPVVGDGHPAREKNQALLFKGEEDIVKTAASWTNLRAVTFDSATISEGMLQALERLKKLECLRITNGTAISPKFASLSTLPLVRILELTSFEPTFLWAKPESFRRLETLSIDCELKPSFLAAISKIPNLKTLHLRQHDFSAATIKWLSQLNVAEVNIDEAFVSAENVRAILRNPNIQLLQVGLTLKPKFIAVGIQDPRLRYVTNSILD